MPAPENPNTGAVTAALAELRASRARQAREASCRDAGRGLDRLSARRADRRPAAAATLAALIAYRDLANELSQWAPTVHRLVCERIAALAEANGPWEHQTETARGYAERVLARGQYPFPAGECLYDDLNNNTGYEHIEVGYGLDGEGGARITYSGWYPQWASDGESYTRGTARIYCPAWLIAEPDGEERYRQETAEMVAAVHQKRADEDAKLDAMMDDLRKRS